MATSGALSQIRVESILGQLGQKAYTGVLRFTRGNVEKELYWERGVIIFSQSNDPHDYLGQYLISRGTISEDDLNMALKTQAETRVLLGRIFIMVGLITEDEMELVLTEKAGEALFDVFLWDEGQWELDQKKRPPEDIVRIHLEPGPMAVEGARRREAWRDIRQAFPNRDVHFRKNQDRIPPDVLNDFERSVYFDLIDEGRSLFEIGLETHRPEFRVAQDLFEMYKTGYLAVAGTKNSGGSATPGIAAEEAARQLAAGEQALLAGNHRAAAGHYKQVLRLQPNNDEARLGLNRSLQELLKDAKSVIAPEATPKLSVTMEALMRQHLTPEEGYLISRINGVWDVKSIVSVSPLKEAEAYAIIKRFLDEGWISLQ